MGAYDRNPRRDSPTPSPHDSTPRTPPWNPNGVGDNSAAGAADRLAGLAVSDASDSGGIYQVIRAVEVAENTIKQQMEENQQLKDQLMRQTRELEKYKLESTSQRPSGDLTRDVRATGPYNVHNSDTPGGSEAERARWAENKSSPNPQGSLVIHENGTSGIENPTFQSNPGNRQYSEITKLNGSWKVYPGAQTGVDSAGFSQRSTPSSRSISPARHGKEGEYDLRYNSSGQGLIPVSETTSNNLWKQDLAIKIREREEEIAMLRKHLADFSVKEAHIRNEKYVLEKRIAYMRMAFDQQQQDLVDAASKALSYRQDIIEENIHLTYALQAAQQERTTFVSSLLPLLTEYNLQPAVLDAQSIVSNLKVLFKHLQEKLILNEDKLKESQYQLAPWHAESSVNTRFPPQSPSHSLGAPIANSNNSMEIVPQPPYSHAQSPISSPNARSRDWEGLGNQNHNPGPSMFASKAPGQDGLEQASPVNRRTVAHDNPAQTMSHDIPSQVTQDDSPVTRFAVDFKDQNPSFKDLVRGNEIDDPEPSGIQQGQDGTFLWGPGTSRYLSPGLDDPNSSYPYLPPVLEEPSSSFSEAAEDELLPGIEGLQISGEAYPGREIQACGISINGTTSCNFEWVRYLEDGSVNYIEGAKQPKYLVTADDVDAYLAIEVHPLDDRKRKGELFQEYANERQKITCDPEMQEHIESTFSIGHTSYEVLLSVRYLDIWEQAVLAIKREGYSIKCNGLRGVVVTEKFSPATAITIPYGHPTEFAIQCSNGNELLLRAKDSSWNRDVIVLSMRLFKKTALERRKGRRKGLFFKS